MGGWVDGLDWILLRRLVQLEHLAVLIIVVLITVVMENMMPSRNELTKRDS